MLFESKEEENMEVALTKINNLGDESFGWFDHRSKLYQCYNKWKCSNIGWTYIYIEKIKYIKKITHKNNILHNYCEHYLIGKY